MIVDQVASVGLYPRFLSEEEVTQLEKSVTKEEILYILKGFSKDKILGPDGWTVEFYLHFFYLIAKDLLNTVEELRRTSVVNKSLNSTFIALIPKVDDLLPLRNSTRYLCVTFVIRSSLK
jgi:hypothetical protein